VSLETMRSVCLGGPGHYLGDPQTLSLMQTEYIYPAVADRTSPKEWAEIGRPDLVAKAIERKNRILAEAGGPLFDREIDRAIREKFRIYF
jgi:trimethylamine--corrinoid protein Co-methyltransferase